MPASPSPRIDRAGGFEVVGLDGRELWVRAGDRPWATAAMEETGSLYRSMKGHPEARPVGGRGPALVVPTPEGTRVVRPYLRGGWMAPLLGDRYLRLGPSRPHREISLSEGLREKGIATPEVTAATTHRAGPFLRAELVTRHVPDSRTLAAALEIRGSREVEEASLTAVGALIRELAEVGLRHPDLHGENVLVQDTERGLRAWVLDLDRCRIVRDPDVAAGARMLRARLIRSLEKRRGAIGQRLEASVVAALDRGMAGES